MTSVSLVLRATPAAMGQQVHERELAKALRTTSPPGWVLKATVVGSWRSGAPVRFPERATLLPFSLARTAARALYPGADLHHRFDLRLPPAPGREVLTVHDLPPLRFKDEGKLARHARASVLRAAAVICPSKFSAREVSEAFDRDDCIVIPNGVSGVFRDPPELPTERKVALGIRSPYILVAGGATSRKNLRGLRAAWTEVAAEEAELQLVAVGPPGPERNLLAAEARVLMTGFLPQHEIASLMHDAVAVVVPSLYEGFGLPALEGMAAGTPVVVSDAGALPEVAADAAIVVPSTSAGLAAGILHAARLSSDERRVVSEAGRKRAASFTWSNAAALTWSVYRRVLECEF